MKLMLELDTKEFSSAPALTGISLGISFTSVKMKNIIKLEKKSFVNMPELQVTSIKEQIDDSFVRTIALALP